VRHEISTEEEMQGCIKKLNARLTKPSMYGAFPLYRKAIKNLERRINELKKIKTT